MFFIPDQDYSSPECDMQVTLKTDINAAFLTCFTNRRDTLSASASDKASDCWSTSDRDILERQIMQANAELLKKALQEYVDCCQDKPFGDPQTISNGKTFYFQKNLESGEEDKTSELLIVDNPLLSSEKKHHLRSLYKQLEQLRDLFQEVNRSFQPKIAQELAYILESLLASKMQGYRQCLKDHNQDYLPKISRILGDAGQEVIFHGGWEVYSDIDEVTIKAFSSLNCQQISKNLYFSDQLKNLTFRNIENTQVSLQKFNVLLNFISESLFMSLSGMSQSEQSMFEYIYELYSDKQGGDRTTKKIKRE